MATNHPVDFSERAKRPPGSKGNDYPYALSANDLMKNFVYAALDADDSLIDKGVGEGGHLQRKLAIPPVPQSDVYVLAAVGGKLEWIDVYSFVNPQN